MLIDEANVRRLATANAGARVVIGVAFLLAPRTLGGRWFGREATLPVAALVTRMVAARDLALGIGMLRALARDEPVRSWFAVSIGVDTVDGVAALAAGRHLPKWTMAATVVSASLGAMSDILLARELDR